MKSHISRSFLLFLPLGVLAPWHIVAGQFVMQETTWPAEWLQVIPATIDPPFVASAATSSTTIPPEGLDWEAMDSSEGPPRSSGPAPQIVMVDYAIGALASTRVGYGSAEATAEDLEALARAAIEDGTSYRLLDTGTGDIGVGENAWVLRFDGAFDETTGQPWVVVPGEVNYNEQDLIRAEQLLLAAIRMYPNQPDAAPGSVPPGSDPFYNAYSQLMRSYTERMIPRIYAGNQALVYSAEMRFSTPLQQEVTVLEDFGYTQYRAAAQMFIDFTSDTSAPLMEIADLGFYPASDPDTDPLRRKSQVLPEFERFVQVMGRSMAMQCEALVRSIRLRYFDAYVHPEDSQFDSGALDSLVQEIDDEFLPDLQAQLIVADGFIAMLQEVYGSEIHNFGYLDNARSGIEALESLRETIKAREISFIGVSFLGSYSGMEGNESLALDPDNIEETNYQVYRPNYVPFYNPGSGPATGSINRLAELANATAERSSRRDAAVENSADEHETSVANLRQSIDDVRRSYFSELIALCGSYRTDGNELVPAVPYSLLTPEQIAALPTAEFDRLEPKVPFQQAIASEIQLQWAQVEQAETGLEVAVQELKNLIARIQKAEDGVKLITNRYNETAKIYNENGETLAGFDLQLGQIQADLYKTIDRISKQNQKKSFWGKVGLSVLGGVARGLLGDATGWATAGQSLADGIGGAIEGHNNAINATKIADARADASLRTAKINEQRTRIATMEKVRAVYDQVFVNQVNSEEEIHSMLLETERRRLDILLAEQRLDQENAKLAGLVGRVTQLLGFYRESVLTLQETNPMSRPDYRLIRNLKISDAEQAFLRAQERAFLVARAARYKVNHSSRSSDLRNLERNILRARLGQDLTDLLVDIDVSIANWYTNTVGSPQTDQVRISLRHDIFQNNYIATNSDGSVSVDDSIYQVQPGVTWDRGAAPAPTARELEEASQAQWAEFLQSHVQDFFGIKYFSLPISLHLLNNRNGNTNSGNPNPLYFSRAYNILIKEGDSVGVHIEGSEITGINSGTPIRFFLLQEGTSYVRSSPAILRLPGPAPVFYPNPDPKALRVWNVLPESGFLQGAGTASFGSTVTGNNSTQFFERSPANDKWVLEFDSSNGSGTNIIINNLDKITDIELIFEVESFIQQ